MGCLTAQGDALLELADAVLCSDRPVRSLVRLSLEPEFRRGHGALYDALAAGPVDDERLFSLLTEVLPPLVDGPEARAWTVGHDVIDCRMLDRALSGAPAGAVAPWVRLATASKPPGRSSRRASATMAARSDPAIDLVRLPGLLCVTRCYRYRTRDVAVVARPCRATTSELANEISL